MTNSIEFPNSIYEFLLNNSFKDTDEVYTNGSLLIPTFRVKQAIEHYYKSCEDSISREDVIEWLKDKDIIKTKNQEENARRELAELPSVTPQPFINKPCISEGVCREDKVNALEKIRAEIKEWYWQADKQALTKDPCVVDAMVDLFIRTIDKYKAESKE